MTSFVSFLMGPLFFSSILHLGSISLTDTENNRLLLAEKLFNEDLFEDAKPIYVDLLSSTENFPPEISNEILDHLGRCYLHLKEYQKAIDLLTPAADSSQFNLSYILAIAHRHLKQNLQALKYLELIKSHSYPKEIATEINFELAINHFHLKNFSQAKPLFQLLIDKQENSHISKKATLYQARIHLLEKSMSKAEELLKQLHSSLPKQSKEYKEYLYLNGLIFLSQENVKKALDSFEQAFLLSFNQYNWEEWETELLYHLVATYLQEIKVHPSEKSLNTSLFKKAEEIITLMPDSLRNEKFYLTLIELHSLKAVSLNDPSSYELMKKIASDPSIIASQEGKIQALLLTAASITSFAEREKLYSEIILRAKDSPKFLAKAYFLIGINEYEEALKSGSLSSEQANLFDRATLAFSQSFSLYKDIASQEANQAIKYHALSLFHQKALFKQMEAWNLINQAILKKENIIGLEDLYLTGALMAFELIEKKAPLEAEELNRLLSEGLSLAHESGNPTEFLRVASLIEIKREKWEEADEKLQKFLGLFPNSPFCGEASYWRAICAENLGNLVLKQSLLKETYEKYADSSYAPQAYFHFYSNKDYLTGSKRTIKHLQSMEALFPHSPLLIKAYYLIGMDLKKDRYSSEGKLQRRKDLTASIEAFNKAEAIFDRLESDHLIPQENLSYYVSLKYQTILERALVNFEIAKESQGTKKRIFLEYAQEVLKNMQQNFKSKSDQTAILLTTSIYPRIWEEAEYRLAEVYMEEEKFSQAEAILNEMLVHYSQAGIKDSYFLSRLWYKKGLLAKKTNEFVKALSYFELADQNSQKLNTDEKLENWIQKSDCCKQLNQFDEAMKWLSKVVNDESISSLRLKAMFLRAEIYELQDKPELAFKQLEAVAKKGGIWAQKAKEELDLKLSCPCRYSKD